MKDPEITWVIQIKPLGRVVYEGPKTWDYIKDIWKDDFRHARANDAQEFRSKAAAFRTKRRLKKHVSEIRVMRRTR